MPDLILTPVVLAAIFRQCLGNATCPEGWIYSWSDPAILALNPDPATQALLRAAGNITVVVRADNSGTTEIFKSALNAYDPYAFGVQIFANNGPSGAQSAVWYNASVTHGNTNQGVVAHVLAVSGAIGYTSLDLARSTDGIRYAGAGPSVLTPDLVLRATTDSVSYALVEKGFAFGNNNDSAAHLTAIISGTTGTEAWPLVGYSYFAVRKDTLRAGATCANRVATWTWLQWFYSKDAAQNAITAEGFGNLPVTLRSVLLQKVAEQLMCNGEPVALNASASSAALSAVAVTGKPVLVYAEPNVLDPLQLYGESYDQASTTTTVATQTTVTSTSPNSSWMASSAANAVYVLDRESALLATYTQPVSVFPAAAAAWGVVYNLCDSTQSTSCTAALSSIGLVLDTQLLLDIVSGVVTWWDDSRIMARTTNAGSLPHEPIVVIGYADGASDLAKLQAVFKSRTGATASFAAATYWLNSSAAASIFVGGVRYSMAIVQINVNQDNSISRVAEMLDAAGQSVVSGNGTALALCVLASDESSTQALNLATAYMLTSSTALGCWPLAETYFFVVRNTFTQSECLTGLPQAAIGFVHHTLSFDTTPLALQGFAQIGQAQAVALLSEITCYGRSIANPVIDPSYLPLGLVYFTWFLAIAIIIGCFALASWIWQHRFHGVVNASSPAFMIQMCIGCIVEVASIIPMSFQENVVDSTAALDAACMIFPWLFFVGFALIYAPLLVKTYRIYRLFNNKKLIRFTITNSDLLRIEAIGFVPVILFMALWTALSPMRWTRTVTGTDSATEQVFATAGTCTCDNVLVALLPIVTYLGLWIVAGVVLTVMTRNAPTEFSEGRYISMNIVMLAEALMLGVPIIILSSQNPLASFLVKMLIVVLTVVLTLGIFFGPKVAVVHGMWTTDESSVPHVAGKRASFSPVNNEGRMIAGTFGGSTRMSHQPEHSPHGSTPSPKNHSPNHSPKNSNSSSATGGGKQSSFNFGHGGKASDSDSSEGAAAGKSGIRESSFPMFGYIKEHSKESLSTSDPVLVDMKSGAKFPV